MTYEDVKRIRERTTAEAVDSRALAKLIDEAVEKQIPKKVITKPIYICPNCGGRVEYLYCLFCGQKLDWGHKV